MKYNHHVVGIVIFFMLVVVCGSAGAVPQPGQHIIQPNKSQNTQDLCISLLGSPFPNDQTAVKKHILAAVLAPLASHVISINFTIANGNPIKRDFIRLLITKNIYHFIHPTRLMFVRNIDFTVEFTIKNPTIAKLNRFMFFSMAMEKAGNNSGMIWSQNHQFTVTGFTGFFKFFRCQPLHLMPAYFMFYGLCEQATLIRTT